MLNSKEVYKIRKKGAAMLRNAGIFLTDKEADEIEVADFGLGEFEKTGLALITYLNTERCCAKELVMLPHQTCPQHKHPPVESSLGKEETFRCRWGKCYLYIKGKTTENPACKPPKGSEKYYTVWHEVVLNPGDQYTLQPNTWHWFQAGDEGAVVSEFSTKSTDENDQWVDHRIARIPVISN